MDLYRKVMPIVLLDPNKLKKMQNAKSLSILLFIFLFSCSKKTPTDSQGTGISKDTTKNVTGGGKTSSSYPGVTPTTVGFFNNGWQAKTFATPPSILQTKPSTTNAIQVTINYDSVKCPIPRTIFGDNGTSWMGQFSDPTFLGYISNLSPNIIRFPGGSISDSYFWNLSAITLNNKLVSSYPSDVPPLPDNSYWDGNRKENWTCALDSFYTFLVKTNNTAIFTVNYAYARYGTSANPVANAAHLAADWVRYDKGRTKYWEIGNEDYGTWEMGYKIDPSKNKDGQPQLITGQLYGAHFQIFTDSMRAAAKEVGAIINIGAVLYEYGNSFDNPQENNWNQGVIAAVGNVADYFIVHNYYTAFGQNSSISKILYSATHVTKTQMDFYKSLATQYKFSLKPVALTEWNIWSGDGTNAVSNITGLHAAMVLGELLNNQFGEATRWDFLNNWNGGNDQGMFSDGKEPGVPIWNPRPSFYYMYYFQKVMGDTYLGSSVQTDTSIHCYASKFSSGDAGLVLANTYGQPKIVQVNFSNFTPGINYYYYSLQGGTDNNGFSRFVYVNGSTSPTGVSGGPNNNYSTLNAYSSPTQGGILVTVPAYGAVFINVAHP